MNPAIRNIWRTAESEFRQLKKEKPRALRRLVEVVFGSKADWKHVGADMGLDSDFIADTMNACAKSPDQTTAKKNFASKG
jgi:hypothetical protein